MKYSKKILEAIQRGINLAIDDFDDVDIETLKIGKIENNSHTKDLLNFVDLGLPSGTLWYKYNVGVDPCNLDNIEDWFGNYYTWPQATSLKDYKLPTEELCEELIKETKAKWTSRYNGIKGLCGKIFIGPNGNSIFIPAAGSFTAYGSSSKENFYIGKSGWIWSSSRKIGKIINPYSLYICSRLRYISENFELSKFSVRPVIKYEIH